MDLDERLKLIVMLMGIDVMRRNERRMKQKNKRGTRKKLRRKEEEEEEEGRTSQKGRKALMTAATVEEGAYHLCIKHRHAYFHRMPVY